MSSNSGSQPATSTLAKQPPAHSVSLSGLLAIISGVGLFLAMSQARHFAEKQDLTAVRTCLFAIAFFLLLWGIKQTVQTLPTSWAADRIRRVHPHRVQLPRQGIVYLGIMAVMFVGSMLGRSNMLMLVFALMAGPFVVNGWITFNLLKRTGVRRTLPHRAMAGETVSVELALVNQKLWLSSWLMAATDRVSHPRERLDANVLFARVPPRSERSAYYQMRLERRGKYSFGPVELTTRFPLGLVERGMHCEQPGEMVVHPRLGRLTPKWKRELLFAPELVQRRQTRKGPYDDEFHRVREYRPGDNPRAIHWRTSARHNELMVREFHQSRDRHLTVLLDLWVPTSPDEEQLDRVELAVSFAATVCVDYWRESRDSQLRVLSSGRGVTRWEGEVGAVGLESLLDTLAVVRAGRSATVGPMIEDALGTQSANASTLLVTTRLRDDGAWQKILSNGRADGAGKHFQIVRADPQRIQQFFTAD